MNSLFRPFPGGIFPRLVALFPLLFPFYVVQGVLLGVPVTLPEVFLTAFVFYFLFEHDSFRISQWKLWPVFIFSFSSVLFLLAGPFEPFEGLKSWVLFPLLYFVVARNVFREKASMVLLSQRAFILLASFLALFILYTHFSQISEMLGTMVVGSFGKMEALSILLGPALVISSLSLFYAQSRREFAFFLLTSCLCFFALYFTGFYLVLLVVFLCGLLHGLLRLKKKGRFILLSSWGLFLGLVLASFFVLFQRELLSFGISTTFVGDPFLLVLSIFLGASVLWMGVKALFWLREQDAHRRFLVSYGLLTFLILIVFYAPSLTVSHLFLFWFFMAILL